MTSRFNGPSSPATTCRSPGRGTSDPLSLTLMAGSGGTDSPDVTYVTPIGDVESRTPSARAKHSRKFTSTRSSPPRRAAELPFGDVGEVISGRFGS